MFWTALSAHRSHQFASFAPAHTLLTYSGATHKNSHKTLTFVSTKNTFSKSIRPQVSPLSRADKLNSHSNMFGQEHCEKNHPVEFLIYSEFESPAPLCALGQVTSPSSITACIANSDYNAPEPCVVAKYAKCLLFQKGYELIHGLGARFAVTCTWFTGWAFSPRGECFCPLPRIQENGVVYSN